MRPLAVKAVLIVLGLLCVAALGGYAWLRQSLPQIDGTIDVAGPAGSIDIVRDADAIPHIFATSKHDALFGLGYVHAQDRLWQMEFQRRIGHGRLSEIFGAVTLPQDRFLRTVGFGRAARSAWVALPASAREQVDAYVAGVNAFIATHRGAGLPPEFRLLRFEPEPWTGPDVMVWVKMMAWDLSANYSLELLRHDLESRVGPARAQELLPPPDPQALTILSDEIAASLVSRPAADQRRPRSLMRPENAPLQGASTTVAALFGRGLSHGLPDVRDLLIGGSLTESLGSNNWVVDGTLTASGKPLLANDPHLGTHVPSLWYLAHMSAGDFDVIGATLPGAPAVAIGRNRHIAWGETNVAADVEDLYRERLSPSGLEAEFQGAFEPLRTIPETIGIKGGTSVTISVRITRHGPLVSDAINANNASTAGDGPKPAPLEPLAFRWTALDDEDPTLVAFLAVNDARSWNDFTGALSQFTVPAQNFVYADTAGHIGYYAPGHVPIRAHGDGSAPATGWTGEDEWTGWIPFDELPHAFDPPDHFIVTANNKAAGAAYPHFITNDYPEPYRAQRITDLIRAHKPGTLTPDDFRTIQADTTSLHATVLLPVLLRHATAAPADAQPALELLRTWDYDAAPASAAAAIFQAWFLELAPALIGDELGPLALEGYGARYSAITRLLLNTLAQRESTWCDDVRTPRRETCDDVVGQALGAALTKLRARLGLDMTTWRWDALHRAVFPHQGLDAVAVLRPLLSRSLPSAGDWSTVNASPVAWDHPYEQRAVPGYRQIVDLSPANDSRFLDAVGQSGHLLSPQYDDFLADWKAVRHRRMRMDRAAAEQGARGTLHLIPREPAAPTAPKAARP